MVNGLPEAIARHKKNLVSILWPLADSLGRPDGTVTSFWREARATVLSKGALPLNLRLRATLPLTLRLRATLLRLWGNIGSAFLVATLVGACTPTNGPLGANNLNSLYSDEQPALSGNGRFMAFVSNRDGKRNIMLYDLQQREFLNLPRLNRRDAIAESPSLSNNARYIVYVASDSGKPEIELYDRITHRWQVLTLGYRGWVRNPSISPSGRYIVFESGRRGQWDLEIIDRGPLIELDIIDGQPLPSVEEFLNQ